MCLIMEERDGILQKFERFVELPRIKSVSPNRFDYITINYKFVTPRLLKPIVE